MTRLTLTNDADRAAWLQCLQAAVTLVSATADRMMAGPTALDAAECADRLFAEYQRRSER